ncbi:hypothetical protein FBU31_004049 [Coemansia sp. 'formosensis']|nr:hypothetical protein FBU31_004049 [Coemansia sp. 'formosensis']
MRSSTKQLASFYKTDFEAPGKHYLYLEKYLALYIETLVATLDIAGVQLVLRKLSRSSDLLHAPSVLQQQATAAELEILQCMARNLNCPKFVVDSLGKEHIILHDALSGASSAQIYSITRHCRLNRSQFNHARDISRDNILFFMMQRELLVRTTAALSDTDSTCAMELDRIKLLFDEYLTVADKAMLLFGHLLDQKKRRAEEPDMMDTLHDCLADVYILILSVYGLYLRTAQIPLPLPPSVEHNTDEVVASFRDIAQLLVTSPMKRSEALFWQNVIFDEARHEPSQQYKLLDPILEFQVNKLLDAVRDATLPQQCLIPARVGSNPTVQAVSPTRAIGEPLASLVQAEPVLTTTASNDPFTF